MKIINYNKDFSLIKCVNLSNVPLIMAFKCSLVLSNIYLHFFYSLLLNLFMPMPLINKGMLTLHQREMGNASCVYLQNKK